MKLSFLFILAISPLVPAMSQQWQEETSADRGRLQYYVGAGNLGFSIRSSNGGGWAWQLVDGGNNSYFHVEYPTQNVGIGTTTPYFRVHIRGGNPNSDVMSLGNTNTANFALTSADGGAYGLFAGVSNTGRSWLQAGRYDTDLFYDLSVQASGGNFGIGTATPRFKLDVPLTILMGKETHKISQDFHSDGIDPEGLVKA